MKSRAVAVMMLLLFLPVIPALALEAVGRVSAVSGDVKATGSDGNVRELAIRSNIYLNDVIVTKDDSRVQICFRDNTTISQGENGEIKIDKYVYDPGRKTGSFVGNIVKGAFRIVTGKIAELNPEKFKVRARMATVGIRGCGVGVVCTRSSMRIYSLELADGSTITIDFTAGGSETLTHTGYVLTVTSGGKVTRSRISAAAAQWLMSQTTPGSTSFQGGARSWLANLWPIPDPTHGGKSGGDDDGSGGGGVPWWARDPYVPPPDGDGGGTDYPIYGSKTYVALWNSGSGDWTGYEWSRLVTDLVGGNEQKTTQLGAYFEPNAGRTWTGVATYPSSQMLGGSGPAAAFITYNGTQRPRLDGTFDFNLTFSPGSATWEGWFDVGNANDTLYWYENNGNVSGTGQLTFNGRPDNFDLKLDDGTTLDVTDPLALTGWSLVGQLVGDPALPDPRGVAVNCEFQVGTTTISGGGATDIFWAS